ncbi:hypothetical protein ILUMI_15906 [Ignelater luminosus]|uniref:Uncharacterized protein n=1 Tax=Ignelater luminosus TaxID=2038154 RepID=A0A8K0CS12_IGNLU|nr:hypothetical protein ILUMI_15906 [Ignelater luminosus]
MRIEMELAKQMARRCENVTKGHSNIKILKLEAETKELELEVSKLLNLLADVKTRETKEKLNELYDSITNKTVLLPPHDSHFMRQQKSYDFKDNVVNIGALGDDFNKLKELIRQAKDGYAGRPPSPRSGKFKNIGYTWDV